MTKLFTRQGDLPRRMGDTSAATREYQAAIAAYPMRHEAQLKLGELLVQTVG